MQLYSEAAVERAMKVQEVILRAAARKITWIQAAEILGVSPRHMRRWKEKYEQFGFHALFDGRRGKTSPRRMSAAVLEEVLRLYREQYFDLNVSHFHEKLTQEHGIAVSYTWTKGVLQGAGLIQRQPRRGSHRKRRERRPLPGMMLHIDASQHQWLGDERWFDLIVILDDATSRIYYAQLVEQESTRTVMHALRQVVEEEGLFCSLYSDRASHFFLTPKAGEPVDRQALTQVGRALRELGIQLIPAYSPQARGRSERSFRTWQGRLPQELRLGGIQTPFGSQPVLARDLHPGVQRAVQCRSGASRHSLPALHARRPGAGLLLTARASSRERQYGEFCAPLVADRAAAVEGNAFGLPRHRLRAFRRDAHAGLRRASGRTLQCRRQTARSSAEHRRSGAQVEGGETARSLNFKPDN
ncbi:MAG: ISNCY family transposase [Acidobacteria bacterium]|nr:ISNCY family transposase [Acidobacteriota bacterium]